jgi:hypothetical protein
MITTPTGPTFVKNSGQSGARSGDHTHVTDAELGFWHALALWKIAIIAEGILRRAQQDPRNRAASGVPVPQTVNHLVALAHEIAARAGI